jgi:hypothetical protein
MDATGQLDKSMRSTPCESLALPPVGVQSNVEQELHMTTVLECEKTVVLHSSHQKLETAQKMERPILATKRLHHASTSD